MFRAFFITVARPQISEYNNIRRKKMKKIMAFLKDEEGASLVEYVLLAVLIGVAAIAGMQLVGNTSNNTLSAVSSHMTAS
jgi:pilus assembly protein Flp/PilA